MTSLARIVMHLGPSFASRRARLHLKETLVERHPFFDTSDTCDDSCILIGGCGRSGTTVLREMLSRHPNIACGPESTILCDIPNPKRLAVAWELDEAEIRGRLRSSGSAVKFAEWFFRRYAATQGKPRWADKTPRNVRVAARLLTQFPNSRFIHVVRDGRDVACSLRNHPVETIRRGRVVPARNTRRIREVSWRWLLDAGAGAALRGHPRVMEVRYEQLVSQPEETLRALCAFIGEAYDPAMADPARSGKDGQRAVPDLGDGRFANNRRAGERVHTASIGRWRRDMTPEERKDFHRIAGSLLIALGYAPDERWVAAGT